LNVHSLEDKLAIYPRLIEEVTNLLIAKGVKAKGIFQIPCPEMEVFSIFRKPLPREPYESPKIRAAIGDLQKQSRRDCYGL
jgi:predicted secreted protein